MKLDMLIYGILQYNIIYNISENIITNLTYTNNMEDIRIFTNKYENKYFTVLIFNNDSNYKLENHLLSLNRSKNRLLLHNPKPVIVKNSNNSELSQDKKYYTVNITGKKYNMNLDVDTNLTTVIDNSQKLVSMYKSTDMNILEESYTITERGLFNKNYSTKEDMLLIDNKMIKFASFEDKYTYCDLLYHNPTEVIYPDKSYSLSYDNYGIMNACKIDNKESDAFMYKLARDKIKTKSVSLHPLFYDSFDPEYIDDGSMRYWALDSVIDEYEGILYVNRKVYEIIDESRLELLLYDIKYNMIEI